VSQRLNNTLRTEPVDSGDLDLPMGTHPGVLSARPTWRCSACHSHTTIDREACGVCAKLRHRAGWKQWPEHCEACGIDTWRDEATSGRCRVCGLRPAPAAPPAPSTPRPVPRCSRCRNAATHITVGADFKIIAACAEHYFSIPTTGGWPIWTTER